MRIHVNQSGQVTKIDDNLLIANATFLSQNRVEIEVEEFTDSARIELFAAGIGLLSIKRQDGVLIANLAMEVARSKDDNSVVFSYAVQDSDLIFAVPGTIQISAQIKVPDKVGAGAAYSIFSTVAVAGFVQKNIGITDKEEYDATTERIENGIVSLFSANIAKNTQDIDKNTQDIANNAQDIADLFDKMDEKANNADLATIAKSGLLSDSIEDETHQSVSLEQKTRWNDKQETNHDFHYGTDSAYNEGDIVYSDKIYDGVNTEEIPGAFFRCKQSYDGIMSMSRFRFLDYFEKIDGDVESISAVEIENLFNKGE